MRIFVTAQASLDHVRVCGDLNEENNLSSVLPRLTREVVVVALREVTRVTSLGVRDWVTWINALEAAGRRVVLYECSPPIVGQINQVANFIGSGHVESFLAPYACDKCDATRLRLVQTRRVSLDPLRAPRALCDECDSYMKLDEPEDAYLAFVPAVRRRAPPPAVERALVELTPTIDSKLRLVEYSSTGSGSADSSSGSIRIRLSRPLTAPGRAEPEIAIQTEPTEKAEPTAESVTPVLEIVAPLAPIEPAAPAAHAPPEAPAVIAASPLRWLWPVLVVLVAAALGVLLWFQSP